MAKIRFRKIQNFSFPRVPRLMSRCSMVPETRPAEGTCFVVLTRNLDQTLFAETTNAALGLSVRDLVLPEGGRIWWAAQQVEESRPWSGFHTDTEARGAANARVVRNVGRGRSVDGRVSWFFDRNSSERLSCTASR
jgi:hypothetical protein